MTKFVLDCSVAITWFFEDEYSPETDRILLLARDHGIVVPALCYYEIANTFLQAEKRGRQTSQQINDKLSVFAQLPLETDEEPPLQHLPSLINLARLYTITAYDAAYLELALRRGLPLATQDKALRQAAEKLGIALLPA